MTVKTGQAWAGAFVTLDATGALEAGTPSGVLYVDGVADAATVTITGSNPYKWSVTLPSLTAGQRVDMYITATISTIATAGFVASEQADTALVSEVKAETASILEDTGTTIPGTITTIDNEIAVIDGIVDNILEDTGTTLDTKINTIDDFLDTEVAAILADTNELQTDLTNGGRLDLLIDAIKAKTDNLPADPADDSDIDAQLAAIKAETALIVEDTGTTIPATLADLALEATLTAIKGAGWTDETLVALMTAIEAISAGSGATAQEVWEYTTRVLTAGTNIDLSSLATAANLAALDGKVDTVDGIVDAILEDTGTTIPGTITTIDNEVAVIDGIVDAILADTNELQTDLADGGRLDLLIDTAATGSSLTAADLWSYTPRTLTNAGVNVNVPATGDPIYLYRDTTNIVSFTNLGVVSGYTEADDKAWFSIKDNLNDTDASAIVHVSTTSPGDSGAASSLLYINGSAPVAATDGSFLFTDYTAGNATLTLKPAASDDLPVYSVTPLYWDIKIYDKSSDVITILQQGTAYILATATRTTS